MSDWLKNAVIRRLTFNSMFDPLSKFILDLKEEDFDILFNKAKIIIDECKREIESKGLSMGKRNCDNIMLNNIKQYCIENFYNECKELLK